MVIEVDKEFVPFYRLYEPHIQWRFFHCTGCGEDWSFGPGGLARGDDARKASEHILCDGREVDIVSATIVSDES